MASAAKTLNIKNIYLCLYYLTVTPTRPPFLHTFAAYSASLFHISSWNQSVSSSPYTTPSAFRCVHHTHGQAVQEKTRGFSRVSKNNKTTKKKKNKGKKTKNKQKHTQARKKQGIAHTWEQHGNNGMHRNDARAPAHTSTGALGGSSYNNKNIRINHYS